MSVKLRKIVTAVVASVAAVIASLGIAAPAYAYDDYVSTDDSDPGARLYWTAYGDIVKVCDREADGYAALGKVGIWVDTYEVKILYTVRAGGNGTCNEKRASDGGKYNLPENRYIYLSICLSSDEHPETYCDWRQWYNG